jgi:hypothetical protein
MLQILILSVISIKIYVLIENYSMSFQKICKIKDKIKFQVKSCIPTLFSSEISNNINFQKKKIKKAKFSFKFDHNFT